MIISAKSVPYEVKGVPNVTKGWTTLRRASYFGKQWRKWSKHRPTNQKKSRAIADPALSLHFVFRFNYFFE
jgi:hypothetical protein